MAEEEKKWVLKAVELNNCPVFTKGDSFHVQLPAVRGSQLQLCALPVASFIPIAVEKGETRGAFPSGYKDCSCRWGYCQVDKPSQPAVEFEEILARKNLLALAFMQQLPESLGNILTQKAYVGHFQAGEVILKSNVSSEAFFILQKGRARISSKAEDGRIRDITVIRKGDCFGEMSILSGMPTSSRVDALVDCTVLSIPKKDFYKLLVEFPSLSVVLYRLLAERIRIGNLKIAQLLSPGLSGDLQIFNFVDLVQIILNSRMSGVLKIQSLNSRARFAFSEGKLRFGQSGHHEGAAALEEILQWKGGAFQFNGEEQEKETNLDGDTMGLLLDALRRLDENSAGK